MTRLRWRTALAAALLALVAGLAGCDLYEPDDVEGVAGLFLGDGPPVFTQVGPTTLHWNLGFQTGGCCLTRSLVSRTIRGDTVTIVPRFRARPCGDRCMAYVSDSATVNFPGASSVRFRIVGPGEEGRLLIAFDTTVVLDPEWSPGAR